MGPFRILLFLAIFVSSFVAAAFAASEPGEVIVTKNDNGKEISVPQGGVVQINMQYPAGTGYSWEIADLDKSRLEVLDVSTKPLKEGQIMGGPILQTWRIKAIAKGGTQLKMYYYRSWEGLGKAADEFEITIRVT
jgi:predicted secreted protein